jgi:hypothetical protein
VGLTAAADFLKEARRLGCAVLVDSGRVGLRGPAEAVERLTPHLRRLKAELLDLLTRPYLDRGDLVVPFGTPAQLCWWEGGLSIAETLDDLNAPESTRRRYTPIH